MVIERTYVTVESANQIAIQSATTGEVVALLPLKGRSATDKDKQRRKAEKILALLNDNVTLHDEIDQLECELCGAMEKIQEYWNTFRECSCEIGRLEQKVAELEGQLNNVTRYGRAVKAAAARTWTR